MSTAPLDPRAKAQPLRLSGRAAVAAGEAPATQESSPTEAQQAAEARRSLAQDAYSGQHPTSQEGVADEALPWATEESPAEGPDAFTSADAVNNAREFAPELQEGTRRAAQLETGGKALGVVGAVAAFGDLTEALKQEPIDWQGALGALGNSAMGLEQAIGELGGPAGAALRAAGGVGAVLGGLASLKQRIDDLKAKGGALDTAAVAGLIADGLQVMAGAATLLAPVCPPLGAAAGALYLASAGANLVAFAAENWDHVERGAAAVADAVGDGLNATGEAIGDGLNATGEAISGAWNWLWGGTPAPAT